MKFYKYHGLGNDYIVIDPAEIDDNLSPSLIRTICHRNFGVGSDGILLGPIETDSPHFFLRIFNPDGSEAEKSGNGLRIFSRYLWDKKRIGNQPFMILTKGGMVQSTIHADGQLISVDMGQVSFDSDKIPVEGPKREVINEFLSIEGKKLQFCAATVGNPHCVIPQDNISELETKSLGPFIETHPVFPRKTNVQFMKILDRNNIALEIWERGAGYTLASGSSSSAAAAVAFKLGLCDADIIVHMKGGNIDIHISDNYHIKMTGPVVKIAEGILAPEMLAQSVLP
ncbi:MAG: diaminopimelate epimerase [Proteobacteria bacterium]|nr:diaminopimelate epimerase [Pseudomonadota bacterium]